MKERGNWFQRLCIVSILTLVLLLASPVGVVFAANPTVTMNVTAGIISINNTQDTWALGYATLDEVIYFSTDGTQDDDWARLGNPGNLAVDIEIQGTDFEGGDYDWTLAAAAGDQIYQLDADVADAGTYSIEVKSASYVDITTNLAADATIVWSMKFTAPTAFDGADDGGVKNATVTLVASEHV